MDEVDPRFMDQVQDVLAPARPAGGRGPDFTGDRSPAGMEVALPSNYSLEGLNIRGDVPLARIVEAVRRFRSGERRADVDRPRLGILLSGVPGGGKTAFCSYLARECGAPLHAVCASDLLSKWIGESERNLAAAFRKAREENAVLLLDEIDSFLFSRDGARHSWEVTQVNELLQQMERFDGVLVGATNLASALDRAVLRRFVFKLELDYLTDEGKRTFFRRFFRTPLTAAERRRLDAIDRLAPGDFRTAYERLFYLGGDEGNAARLRALEQEAAAKGRGPVRVGF